MPPTFPLPLPAQRLRHIQQIESREIFVQFVGAPIMSLSHLTIHIAVHWTWLSLSVGNGPGGSFTRPPTSCRCGTVLCWACTTRGHTQIAKKFLSCRSESSIDRRCHLDIQIQSTFVFSFLEGMFSVWPLIPESEHYEPRTNQVTLHKLRQVRFIRISWRKRSLQILMI